MNNTLSNWGHSNGGLQQPTTARMQTRRQARLQVGYQVLDKRYVNFKSNNNNLKLQGRDDDLDPCCRYDRPKEESMNDRRERGKRSVLELPPHQESFLVINTTWYTTCCRACPRRLWLIFPSYWSTRFSAYLTSGRYTFVNVYVCVCERERGRERERERESTIFNFLLLSGPLGYSVWYRR